MTTMSAVQSTKPEKRYLSRNRRRRRMTGLALIGVALLLFVGAIVLQWSVTGFVRLSFVGWLLLPIAPLLLLARQFLLGARRIELVLTNDGLRLTVPGLRLYTDWQNVARGEARTRGRRHEYRLLLHQRPAQLDGWLATSAERLELDRSVPIEEFLTADGQLLRDIQEYAPHIELQH